MTFQIEFDVPLPVRTAPGGRRGSKYPFAEMDVGASFLVPGDVKAQTIRSATAAYAKRAGDDSLKFSVRAVSDGVRVWRVA